ncbi:Na+/H+ antiporter NhaA type [Candidatus Syntrophocurvum alkaliphilum]|uniref:Na(+)/H(+) antiporter NhaA n=1 Tax=Candidatus Syntrophocurvum alkaliphilum TaxID=2293317 RepID=A0A6I6DC73_9FIRM|nr:Na+/H+ antiporter NhaA [Candidatus Syntrophocurvum alkaliphilum]QGT99024.1 Na+/H+ antiporter NhaA type [Candidatus Syntrophocurvum alkaliphilum]
MENNKKLMQLIKKIFDTKILSSQLLLLATIIALVWANTTYASTYFALWQTEVSFQFGNFVLTDTLGHWINDGLMVIFFFVIGLEIKREIMIGELSTVKKAGFPIAAAIGGMVVPALIFVVLNIGTEGLRGWGIPMATDIAFALGILMALGTRIPLALKVFLLALAIVDDMGAILVIAFFYTEQISINSLLFCSVVLFMSLLLNRLQVRKTYPYVILGIILWLAFLQSGVHATLAGVLLAFTIPAKARFSVNEFKCETEKIINNFSDKEFIIMCDESQTKALHKLQNTVDNTEAPLQRMEHILHPIAVFFIVPLFALANAGVTFIGVEGVTIFNNISLGIILGLFFGKQIGVTLFSWIAVKLGWANLPSDVTWTQVWGVSCLAGVGFTMSLFITNLAYTTPLYLEQAKIGILTGSLMSAILGIVLLLIRSKHDDK